jgi:hypothetical protein
MATGESSSYRATGLSHRTEIECCLEGSPIPPRSVRSTRQSEAVQSQRAIDAWNAVSARGQNKQAQADTEPGHGGALVYMQDGGLLSRLA